MRPPKKVLLVGENEFTLSPLRFLLRNNGGGSNKGYYSITSAGNAEEAIEALKTNPYDLLLAQMPVASLDALLSHVKATDDGMKTMVITDKYGLLESLFADAILFRPTSAAILEQIAVLVKRKRGPAPGYKKKVAGIVARQIAKQEVA